MNRILRQFVSLCTLACLAVGMTVSVAHIHVHSDACGSVESVAEPALSCCSCAAHRHASEIPVGDEIPFPVDHDEDNCLICRLLANFHFSQSPCFELQFDSFATEFAMAEIYAITSTPHRRYQGRAPPVS